MTPRGFLVILVLAGLALAGAIHAVVTEPRPGAIVQAETPAFPALRANPDAVARVVVSGEDGRIELERVDAERWVALSKHGYPADARKLRTLVVRLSDMHLVEAKTRRQDLLYRLELEGPEAPETKSHGLRLEDARGEAIIEAVFGQRHWRRTGAARNGIYFRYAGETQAWLAGGGYSLDGGVIAWLETVILDLKGDQIRTVSVAPAGARAYAITRDAATAPFALDSGPASSDGAAPADPAALIRLAEGLQDVKLKDLVPAADQPWPDTAAEARFTSFDGRIVTLETAEIDGKPWLRLVSTATAEADDTARQAAEALSARTAGWSYQVSPYVPQRIAPALETLQAGGGS